MKRIRFDLQIAADIPSTLVEETIEIHHRRTKPCLDLSLICLEGDQTSMSDTDSERQNGLQLETMREQYDTAPSTVREYCLHRNSLKFHRVDEGVRQEPGLGFRVEGSKLCIDNLKMTARVISRNLPTKAPSF